MSETLKSKYRNKLAEESSPYLLQHAENPVNWYPWGKEAFDKAQQEDKLVLISIGYSACHWCHVMEHESFEDEEVAEIMNRHFVCIKVDREERPDVDQVYMDAIQLLAGNGGWPLNCFTLPDGKPIFGGTYFPKEKWTKVLAYLSTVYRDEKDKVITQAGQIVSALQQYEISGDRTNSAGFTPVFADTYYQQLSDGFDLKEGGYTGAPKFPMPAIWLFLLRYHHLNGNRLALEQTKRTLDKLADGGIYDQIGGGFARYSVDALWKVPHFEKMLYDNAQLISLYSEAFQLTKKEKYKQIVYESIEFISRELTSHEGAFYSSLDADSEGEEGKFYCWGKEEIVKVLKDDSPVFCDYFNISAEGNWEQGKSILFRTKSAEELCAKYRIKEEKLSEIISNSNRLLLNERNKRTRPGLDDKTLTSWNALMIKGLTDAYRVFNTKAYLEKAIAAADFILNKQTKDDGSLFRNYKNGKSSIAGFLDDYALVTDAFINLYRCTFDEKWLHHATKYTSYTFKYFYNRETFMFYYTDSSSHDLIIRKSEITDNVIPSSNSVMANNLFKLGKYVGNNEYLKLAEQMLSAASQNMLQYSRYYSNWAILMLNHAFPVYEVAISGSEAEMQRIKLENYFLPEIILAGSQKPSDHFLLQNRFHESKTLIYVCVNNQCNLPVKSIDEAMKLLVKKNTVKAD